MDIINEIINLLKIAIIPIGVTFRVIFCLTKMIYDEEAQSSYKKKIKNTLVFGIIVELCFVIRDLIVLYYSSSGGGGITGGR